MIAVAINANVLEAAEGASANCLVKVHAGFGMICLFFSIQLRSHPLHNALRVESVRRYLSRIKLRLMQQACYFGVSQLGLPGKDLLDVQCRQADRDKVSGRAVHDLLQEA